MCYVLIRFQIEVKYYIFCINKRMMRNVLSLIPFILSNRFASRLFYVSINQYTNIVVVITCSKCVL